MRTVDTVFIAGAFKLLEEAEHTLVRSATESAHYFGYATPILPMSMKLYRQPAGGRFCLGSDDTGKARGLRRLDRAYPAERSEELARSFAIEIGTPLATPGLYKLLWRYGLLRAPALASAVQRRI